MEEIKGGRRKNNRLKKKESNEEEVGGGIAWWTPRYHDPRSHTGTFAAVIKRPCSLTAGNRRAGAARGSGARRVVTGGVHGQF